MKIRKHVYEKLNPKKLHIFLRVAELKSFTKVANELNMTQPAITITIKSIEKYYIEELFNRQGKKIVSLTSTGEKLYQFAQKYFNDADEFFVSLEAKS